MTAPIKTQSPKPQLRCNQLPYWHYDSVIVASNQSVHTCFCMCALLLSSVRIPDHDVESLYALLMCLCLTCDVSSSLPAACHYFYRSTSPSRAFQPATQFFTGSPPHSLQAVLPLFPTL